eukprot:scaffold6060_cov118-Pinguiococcus_pyrenoidosus.AAC.1
MDGRSPGIGRSGVRNASTAGSRSDVTSDTTTNLEDKGKPRPKCTGCANYCHARYEGNAIAELACVRKRRAIGGVHGEGCVLGVARIVHLEHVHGVDSWSTRRQQDVWVVQ